MENPNQHIQYYSFRRMWKKHQCFRVSLKSDAYSAEILNFHSKYQWERTAAIYRKCAAKHWCIWEAGSHRRLNKHSMSILAVGGPAGIVQCVNQSLEAHWLHSSLVYFKAKGWAVFNPPPLPTSRRFTQSHCCCCWRQLSNYTDVTSAIFYSHKAFTRTKIHLCITEDKIKDTATCLLSAYKQEEWQAWKSCKTVLQTGHYEKKAYDSNSCILCRRLAKIPP